MLIFLSLKYLIQIIVNNKWNFKIAKMHEEIENLLFIVHFFTGFVCPKMDLDHA